MDVSIRPARTDRDIIVETTNTDCERRAIGVLAAWASECMGHDEAQARIYATRACALIEDGMPCERVISDIGTSLERAGKPALAGLVDIVFAQALAGTSAQSETSMVLRRGLSF